MRLFVVAIDKIHNHFHHCIFLIRLAFRYHQCESHKGVVGYPLGAVRVVEDAIVVHKPKEQRRSDTLVAIRKRMVLRDEIEQHRRLLLNGGVQVHTTKGLIYLSDAAPERVVFLVAK